MKSGPAVSGRDPVAVQVTELSDGRPREETMLQCNLGAKAGRTPSGSGEVSHLSDSYFQLIVGGPPKLWRAIYHKVHQFKCKFHLPNTLTEISRIVFNHNSGQCGPTKVTHKISHHTSRELSHLYFCF